MSTLWRRRRLWMTARMLTTVLVAHSPNQGFFQRLKSNQRLQKEATLIVQAFRLVAKRQHRSTFITCREAPPCLRLRKVTALIKPVYGDQVSVVQACSG